MKIDMDRRKFRIIEDHSKDIQDYFDLVVKTVLPPYWVVVPDLEICDDGEIPYAGLYEHSKKYPVIKISHFKWYVATINHEMAHHVCAMSSHAAFGSVGNGHHVVFACTCAMIEMLMKRKAAFVGKKIPYIPVSNGVDYLSTYDVWEEQSWPLKGFNGLSFVEEFYHEFKYLSDDAFNLLSIDDICQTASHARAIYLGSLDLNMISGYPEIDVDSNKKMRSAIQKAVIQRLKKAMSWNGIKIPSNEKIFNWKKPAETIFGRVSEEIC